MPITKTLILSVKNSHAKYQADLEAKRKLAEQEVTCKRQLEADEQGQEKEKQIRCRDPFEEK